MHQTSDIAQLYAGLYADIKRIAHVRLAQVGGAGQLSTTALANEGFLKLAERENLSGDSRAQFLSYVGKVLRSIVLDHLREQGAVKRGGDCYLVTLSHAEQVEQPEGESFDLQKLDAVMNQLIILDPALYQTLEMNAFTGLSTSEIARTRSVSERTVQRDLVKARALVEQLMAG